jgi:DNA-binding cell septation regulator SpoVG
MEIKDVKQINKGGLKLSFSAYFPQVGLTIRECKLLSGKSGDWVSFPSREYQDPEGKKKYFNYFVIDDKLKEAFQKKCLELLSAQSQAVPEENMNALVDQDISF